jgi:hypothetical protein
MLAAVRRARSPQPAYQHVRARAGQGAAMKVAGSRVRPVAAAEQWRLADRSCPMRVPDLREAERSRTNDRSAGWQDHRLWILSAVHDGQPATGQRWLGMRSK